MYPPVFSIAFADSAVTNLIGSSPCRLYPFGEAPEDTPTPYVAWTTISGFPENYINESPDIDSWEVQIDVFASTADSARAVATALRNAYQGSAHITAWRGESRDPKTKNYRYSFDVEFFVSR